MALIAGALRIRRGRFTLETPSFTVGSDGLAVVGPNGSGKSTLLLALRGLLAADGVVAVPSPAASVFATPALLRGTVRRNVEIASRTTPAGIDALLDALGLATLAAREVRTLSSGERQRVGLARALAVEPRALFLDEALANVDADGRVRLRRLIAADAARAGYPVVVATQSWGDVRALSTTTLILGDGAPRLVATGAADPYLDMLRAEAGVTAAPR